jgi:hypothetical protein
VILGQFWPKIIPPICFFFLVIINKCDFHIFVCFDFLSLYGVFGCPVFVRCVCFPVFVRCLFVSG